MSEHEAKATKPQVKNPQLGPQAMETVWALVPQPLQEGLGWQVVEDVFTQMRSTRETGRVSKSVVKKLWAKLGEYPPQVVRDGIDVFLEQHRTKEERYLVGIVRSEAKQQARAQRIGKAETTAAAAGRPAPEVGLPQAAVHLGRVVMWLRECYALPEVTAEQRVELGKACKAPWQAVVKDNVPDGVEVPVFSPYGF
jgi:xanthine/CO dehydrogenase XdhC/CoxF family maturation factor